MSEGNVEILEELINNQVIPKVIQLASCEIHKLQLPCIRILGNLISGDDSQAQIVIHHGGIRAISAALTNENQNIRKEAT